MNPWELIPFKKIGPLTFGDYRESVRAQLGPGFHTLQKQSSPNEIDAYKMLGLHLYYDSHSRLNCAEVAGSISGSLYVAGLPVFAGDLPMLIDRMAAKGFPANPIPSGCYFLDLGIAVYAPDRVTVESIGAFDSSEFASYLQLLATLAERRRLRAERRGTQ